MTVAELIEALRTMPPEAEVVTHAVNHESESGKGAIRVARCRVYWAEDAVLIGDFGDGRHVDGPILTGPILGGPPITGLRAAAMADLEALRSGGRPS